MDQRKVRRSFVLDREENVVGVLSLDEVSVVHPLASGEVLQAITAKAQQDEAQTVEDLHPAYPCPRAANSLNRQKR
jgi:hypothetical protein